MNQEKAMKPTALSLELINYLKENGKTHQVPSQHTLLPYNQVVKSLFLILRGGAVSLHVNPHSGNERAINFFTPEYHPIAAVADSLYYQTPSNYHVKTFTNSHVVEINHIAYHQLLSHPQFGEEIQKIGIESLLEKNTLRTFLIGLNSEEMFFFLQKTYPELLRTVPSKYIADFLGISPQWLSKLKRKL